MATETTKRAAPQKSNWLLWWRISEKDLRRQVAEYHTLRVWQSMRGIGALLLAASAAVSVVLIELMTHDRLGYIDVGLFLFLGLFLYLGHRWAMIAAMVLWTLEKALQAVSSPIYAVTAVIWWALYMHAFYFAFRIEQRRRRETTPPDIAGVFD
jgi:hypothetical protein